MYCITTALQNNNLNLNKFHTTKPCLGPDVQDIAFYNKYGIALPRMQIT